MLRIVVFVACWLALAILTYVLGTRKFEDEEAAASTPLWIAVVLSLTIGPLVLVASACWELVQDVRGLIRRATDRF